MNKLLLKLMIIASVFTFSLPQAFAGYVNGYYRSNGTYVNGYYRTEADGNPYNNYSYPGNYNPNTGKVTGGNADTYLNNYYKSSGSSYSSSGYSDYTSSYKTTPSCPLYSYYDGISSCKCDYGYVVSGGSCVTKDSLCHKEIGYSSSYDSLDNVCKCDYGYVIGDSGQCVSASLYCSSSIGVMSQYNSVTKRCECMSGYAYNGSTCEYKKTSYSDYSSYNSAELDLCPINSTVNKTDNKCYCNSGYKINSDKTSCIISMPSSSGSSSIRLNSNLFYGDTGNEVILLQTILVEHGYLNTSSITGYYGNKTREAVKKYQKDNGLVVTGIVYEDMRSIINLKLSK